MNNMHRRYRVDNSSMVKLPQWSRRDYLFVLAAVLVGAMAVWARPSLLTAALATFCLLIAIRNATVETRRRSNVQHTRRVELENKLLIESIRCAPVAFAVYDPDDRLLTWNATYEKLHPKAFAAMAERQAIEPMRYTDMVGAALDDDLSSTERKHRIAERVRSHREATGEPIDREYADAGWWRVTKFVTEHGAVAGIALDITEIKKHEAELRAEIENRIKLQKELHALATTDSLTGVLNRRAFLEHVETESKRLSRYGTPFSIIMFDIDWFKSVNDRFGHQAGDQVLVSVVQMARQTLRERLDLIGRLGGEEFGILLPHSDEAAAAQCAKKIQKAIEGLTIQSEDHLRIPVTASFGVSQINVGHPQITNLIGQADRAMYESKRNGRNQVTRYSALIETDTVAH